MKIEKENLEKAVLKAVETAFEFGSWTIPIFADPETGKLSVGDPMSSNSFQPGAFEVWRVKGWVLSDQWPFFDSEPTEDDLEAAFEERAEEIMAEIEEWAKSPFNEERFEIE